MKYQIKDIKAWGEIIIDDDKTFEELIEFYLPFRLSELDTEGILNSDKPKESYDYYVYEAMVSEVALRLNPKGPRLWDIEVLMIDFEEKPELEQWANQVCPDYGTIPSLVIVLYLNLFVFARNSRKDETLAMDIFYCILGMTFYKFNHESFENQEMDIAKAVLATEVARVCKDRDLAGLIYADILTNCFSLFELEYAMEYYFDGPLGELLGKNHYFDRALEILEDEKCYRDSEAQSLFNLAKLSLKYQPDKSWARKMYKAHLDNYPDDYNYDLSPCIDIAESVVADLGDKKWAGEIYDHLLSFPRNKYEMNEINASRTEALGD